MEYTPLFNRVVILIIEFDPPKTLEFIFNQYQYAKTVCAIVILALISTVFVFVLITIIRYYKGDRVSFFKVIQIQKSEKLAEADNLLKQLQEEFNIVNAISKQRGSILSLFNAIHKEISDFLTIQDRKQFEDRKNKLIDLTIAGVVSHLTKQRDNVHRVALFKLHPNKISLISTQHIGYFPGEYPCGISLPLNSVAGKTFFSGEPYNSPNVHEDPLYFIDTKHKTDYSSLLCVPITNNGDRFGVLSIDGKKKNSFDKRDMEYLNYFATLIGLIMGAETLKEDTKILEIERRYS